MILLKGIGDKNYLLFSVFLPNFGPWKVNGNWTECGSESKV